MALTCRLNDIKLFSCSVQRKDGCLLAAPRQLLVRQHQAAASSGPSSKIPSLWVCGRNQQVVVAKVAADGGVTASMQEVFVEEVMNPHPVLLSENLPMKEAVHKMLDANVSGAPVVNDAGQLVGVLTEADVIWKGAGRPEDHYIIPPVFIGFADAFIYLRDNKRFDEEVHKILARTVSEAMAKDKIISVTPSTPMSEAAHLMLHHDVNLLPVTEGPEGKVIGVVTRHDILRGIYASKSAFL